jgi:phospholipid/cholesterol/gamma-HCH transport system substrate-binding protein
LENRAHYALIGIFTLAVLTAAFAFVWWFNLSRNGAQLVNVRLIFTGSVSGLSRGSVVRFNGLRVGEVTEISLMADDPSRVSATIAVDPLTPLKADTRARLEYSGLTGVAAVQLTGGTKTAPVLATPDGEGSPTIFADRSDFQDVLESVQRIAGRTDSLISRAEKLLADNEPAIGSTLKNVETFSQALAENSQGVSAFLAAMGDAGNRISSLSVQLERLATDADAVLRGIDPASLNRTLGNIENVTQTLADSRSAISTFLADASATAKQLSQSATRFDSVMAQTQQLTSAIDATKVQNAVNNIENFSNALATNSDAIGQTIKNISEASTAIRNSTSQIDKVLADVSAVTSTFSGNKEVLDALIKDSGTLVRDLNGTAGRLDKALADFSELATALDAEKINTAVADVNKFTAALGQNAASTDAALKNVAEMAEKLNKASDRVDSVLKAAEDFLGPDGGGGENLISDLRKTLADFSATALEFQQTAQSVTSTSGSAQTLIRNLDKRTADISAGINKLTSSGLKDFRALAQETKRAVTEINRTAGALRRNPSQVIFGGQPDVPDYQGSR